MTYSVLDPSGVVVVANVDYVTAYKTRDRLGGNYPGWAIIETSDVQAYQRDLTTLHAATTAQ